MQGLDVSPQHVVTTPVIGTYRWLQIQLREVQLQSDLLYALWH